MKYSLLTTLLLFTVILSAQSLDIDFESSITTEDFIDFDGGTAEVISNPQMNGLNTSATVARIVRNGGAIWGGSKIDLENNLDFTTNNTISMKVYTNAPVGTIVKFKLEGDGETERDAITTVSNAWEELTWDFTGAPTNYNSVVFMFDFGNVGDGSESSTFLFDDVLQYSGGSQMDLPVDFDGNEVNYILTDFEGNSSALVQDPTDESNTVAQCMKTSEASPSAGTTIGTPAGFATDIPLTLTDSKMTVRVWSPAAGIPIRLKVEDSNDPTHTCETEVNTTVTGWETLEFDFNNQAQGTELLSIGLDMGWTYNMASIFFNFGTDGAQDNGQVYYFDDVQFGGLTSSTKDIVELDISVAPNPTSDMWLLNFSEETIAKVELLNISGQLIKSYSGVDQRLTISANQLDAGIYFARIYSDRGEEMIKLIKSN